METISLKGRKAGRSRIVAAEDPHAMSELVIEEPAIEPACAESTLEKSRTKQHLTRTQSMHGPDTDNMYGASCEEVPEGSVVADGGDGIWDKMSEHFCGPN